MYRKLLLMLMLGGAFGLVGCDDGDDLEDGVENIEDGVEDAVDDVEDAVDEATDG